MLSGLFASLLALAAAAAAFIGPTLLAGGPIGLVIAWLGAKAASRTIRLVAILAGLTLLVSSAVAITIHWQHLERDAALLVTVKAELVKERAQIAALGRSLGCESRANPAERELAACFAAQRADLEHVRAEALERQRTELASEQAELGRQQALSDAAAAAAFAAIAAAPPAEDGPVPKVLRESWSRARAARGIK